MPSTEIYTSKCNAGSLTKGDRIVDGFGRVMEVSAHPSYVGGWLIRIQWRFICATRFSRLLRTMRSGLTQETSSWPRNYPLNRIVGARSGGQV